ncbi:hypothetical protein NC99_45240 [Sunxiuqinia dokdonensis]|uniref:Uncharacterized protein n=1 Tax=Sunxiuqinia dokdonensis TaxID=1409788 RepID=A0A0L8V2J8_9BACT|nr:hypothetical protein NC99_45240 [Sunxiuqinia dokdonensis]
MLNLTVTIFFLIFLIFKVYNWLALRPGFFLINVHQSNNSSVAVFEPQFSDLYRLAPHFQGFFAPLKTLSLLTKNKKLLLKCSADHLKHAAECLKHAPE